MHAIALRILQIAICLTFVVLGSVHAQSTASTSATAAVEFFERRIRPVLAQDCYECHSSNGKQQGGLALDHRAALLRGGDNGPVIAPSLPLTSRLLLAIRRSNPQLQMPKGRPPLAASVIADFEQWLRDGAMDPRDHPPSKEELAADTDWDAVMRRRLTWWSFQPIHKTVPADNANPATNKPIDQFVSQQQKEHHLVKAPRAEPAVLLRRLSFALRGLPPSKAEIAAFAEAEGQAEYTQCVDTWLATPQFGEHWARHWMDWLRYADSHGSEGDAAIPYAWRYRDYLIRALNQDVGYDQLLREHLAGDLLPRPRLDREQGRNESALGTGHLRMVFHGYAPTDPREELIRFTDDQIDVVSKAFLGLTVSCARCHDHKFDPISQRDYTALYGIFTSSSPAVITSDAPSETQQQLRARLTRTKADLQAKLAARFRDSAQGLVQQLTNADEQLRAAISQAKSPSDLLHGFAVLNEGKHEAPLQDWRKANAAARATASIEYDLALPAALKQWRRSGIAVQETSAAGAFAIADKGEKCLLGIYPAGTYSHLTTMKDRGVLLSPSIALDRSYDLWLRVTGDGGAAVRYVVQHYPRDGSVFPITELNSGQWRWLHFSLNYWTGDEIHVELTTAADQPVLAKTDVARSFFGVREVLVMPSGKSAPTDSCEFAQPILDAFLAREPASTLELAEGYAAALRIAAQAWLLHSATDAQALYLDALLRADLLPNQTDQHKELAALLAECRSLETALLVPERCPGVIEIEPNDAPLLLRGNYKQPSTIVPRRSLSAFGGTISPAKTSGRLELAEDWLRRDNPLVARVIVNRIWHHLFGRGLVLTTDNFGHMGTPPSHPELLDYLASEFVEQGWSQKTLIRQIVLSDAFQRSSTPTDGALERDPENIYLSHFAVRRIEAESIRDALLTVAGDLDPAQYGQPVSGNSPRRSVYVRQQRNDMDPFLAAFDEPVPASTKGQRDVTNVPAQSLAMLNSPFVMQCAEHWAAQLDDEHSQQTPGTRIDTMYVTALGRMPTAIERDRALAFVQQSAAMQKADQQTRLELNNAIQPAEQQLRKLDALAVERLRAQREKNSPPPAGSLPQPIAAWDFDKDTRDHVGEMHGELHGEAKLFDNTLVLAGGQSYVSTAPLRKTVREKTLLAVVQVDNLSQQGGGVISLQDLEGTEFDALVFGEQDPGQWLAGSNLFTRTQSFHGPWESSANDRPVHLALVYADDGTITAYRNGEPYGSPYKTSGPVTFTRGKAQILIGLRHGTPAEGRLLKGRIHHAALFDRALSSNEILLLAQQQSTVMTDALLRASLSLEEQTYRTQLSNLIAADRQLLQQLDRHTNASSPWALLAHAMCNQKEFLYLR
ncbi:MAG: DUF1553 domain-containing protein [Planctomycetes bacterium]|nr:DUF1553 domain-containing protein [Planctomycetota bacterium]